MVNISQAQPLNKFDKFKEYKLRTSEEIVLAMRNIGLKNISYDLERCGDFVKVVKCHKCKTRHFKGFTRCKNKFCLQCNWIKSLLWFARLFKRCKEMNETHWFVMFTLTYRDQDNLDEMIKSLESSWRRLIHTNKDYRKKFKTRFTGGVRSLEVKVGENSGRWHAHYHIMATIPKGLPFEKDYDWLQPAWKDVTNGEGSVEIHKVKKKGKNIDIADAIKETVKYMVKPMSEIYKDKKKFSELYYSLKSKRQINCFGSFIGICKEVEEDEKQEDFNSVKDFVCQLCGNTVGYMIMEQFNKIINKPHSLLNYNKEG